MGYSNCILKEAKVDFTECICSFVVVLCNDMSHIIRNLLLTFANKPFSTSKLRAHVHCLIKHNILTFYYY